MSACTPRVSHPGFDHNMFCMGGLANATGIEAAWEFLENSDFVMERFREHFWEYKGDSVQNIGGDILAMVLGYSLGTVFFDARLWWLSLVWIYLSEDLFWTY